MFNITNKRILVNFAGSMIGKELVKKLRLANAFPLEIYHDSQYNIINSNIIKCDLLNYEHCERMFRHFAPIDAICNGVGTNGNIKYNTTNCADIFGESLYSNINILGMAASNKINKVVNLLTSCAYSPTDKPLLESQFLSGSPDSSVEAHGFAKKSIFAYGKYLSRQYKLNCVSIIFNNCYGYAPFSRLEKLKVADNLVKKFVDAKNNNDKTVDVWGTGNARRSLLFCEDAAEAIIEVLTRYDDNEEPINIETGIDISIKDLAFLIKNLVGFNGDIIFDTSKPDGQMAKLLDITKMNTILNWFPPTKLEDGLKKTIDFYQKNYCDTQLVKA